MKKGFLLVSSLITILVIFYGVYSFYQTQLWTYQGPVITFEIKPGEGFASINNRLTKNKLINNPRLFYHYSRFKNLMGSFKIGTYKMLPGSTMNDILDTLVGGKSIFYTVTIPEGKNLYQIAKMLEAKKLAKAQDFIKLAKSQSLAKELGVSGKTFEGYLFPETYHFAPNTPAKAILKKMVATFKQQTKNIDFSKSKFSKHQLLTLASIVEKETGAPWERPKIAGVFVNRLKKKMRLQSDPTTIYGIYERFDGNLRKKDLLEKTAYNTYKISGLPPGPICNPGVEAIVATLNPDSHSYLYFVSFNDGTHKFSKTYTEHLQAVNKYQRSSINRRGKSWRDLYKKIQLKNVKTQ